RAPHHPDILSLHNPAAECFLRSGDLKAGGPMLNQCVEHAGLRTPSSQLALFASIAWQRVQIGRRDALRAVPTPGRVPARRRQQMEACWTAMIGLVWVDVILGTHFQLKHSTLALEYGDTHHTVRALAAEACYLAVDVHGSAERSVACISRAQRFAAQADDPQLQAFAAGCAASAAYLRGEFSTSLAASFTADEHVRRCRSRGDWTLADSSLVRMNAHASLGDLNAM